MIKRTCVLGEYEGRVTDEEREQALEAFELAVEALPDRPRNEVLAELEQLARARRGGGRTAS